MKAPTRGPSSFRVGTWNLAGRWSPAHRALLDDSRCDVWFLTEVPRRLVDAAGASMVVSDEMPGTGGRRWAAVASGLALRPVEGVHPAAACAHLDGMLLCSCVLPWRSARATWPDDAENTAGRTVAALGALEPALAAHPGPVVWGGDWNHAMTGPESAGSIAGRAAIHDVVARLGLRVTTAGLPHRLGGRQRAIDHLAVPAALGPRRAHRIPARGLSDHDAYVVDLQRPEAPTRTSIFES